MNKLTETSRKFLRMVFLGVGTAIASLSFTACPPVYIGNGGWGEYGMPPDEREEIFIRGQVKCKKTDMPLRGIAIYIKALNYNNTYITHSTGDFYIWAELRDNYTIMFTDIDGEENGGRYRQKTIQLTKEEAEALYENPLIVELELEEEAEEEIED